MSRSTICTELIKSLDNTHPLHSATLTNVHQKLCDKININCLLKYVCVVMAEVESRYMIQWFTSVLKYNSVVFVQIWMQDLEHFLHRIFGSEHFTAKCGCSTCEYDEKWEDSPLSQAEIRDLVTWDKFRMGYNVRADRSIRVWRDTFHTLYVCLNRCQVAKCNSHRGGLSLLPLKERISYIFYIWSTISFSCVLARLIGLLYPHYPLGNVVHLMAISMNSIPMIHATFPGCTTSPHPGKQVCWG